MLHFSAAVAVPCSHCRTRQRTRSCHSLPSRTSVRVHANDTDVCLCCSVAGMYISVYAFLVISTQVKLCPLKPTAFFHPHEMQRGRAGGSPPGVQVSGSQATSRSRKSQQHPQINLLSPAKTRWKSALRRALCRFFFVVIRLKLLTTKLLRNKGDFLLC